MLNAAASQAAKRGKKREETRTHRSWRKMIERCSSPNCRQWPYYGGRGIEVCERWLKFENFLADMGERPDGTTLDRWPNKDGNYEPSNSRWATSLEQARNQRHCILVEYQGERVLMRDLCDRLGLDWMRVYQRLRAGISVEDALALPLRATRKAPRGECEMLGGVSSFFSPPATGRTSPTSIENQPERAQHRPRDRSTVGVGLHAESSAELSRQEGMAR